MEILVKEKIHSLLTVSIPQYVTDNNITAIEVYNGAPANANVPYVDVDEHEDYPFNSKENTGSRINQRIHIYHSDRDHVSGVIDNIFTTLNRTELDLSPNILVGCHCTAKRSFKDADGETFHGIIDFEITAHHS